MRIVILRINQLNLTLSIKSKCQSKDHQLKLKKTLKFLVTIPNLDGNQYKHTHEYPDDSGRNNNETSSKWRPRQDEHLV